MIPLAVLLIVGATLSWVAYGEYRQAQESEYRLLAAHARNAEVQILSALDKEDRVLNQIAQVQHSPARRQKATISAVLARLRQDHPELVSLIVADAFGIVRAASDSGLIGRDISQDAYFLVHQSPGAVPKMFMSRPDKRLLGTPLVTMTRPLLDGNGRFIGVVGANIDFHFFLQALKEINPDDSASMTVIFNRDGDLLFRRSDPEKFFGMNILKISTVFHEHFAEGKQVTRHIGPSAINGKTRLFLIRDAGDSGLSLILSRQLDEVLAPWLRNVTVYALIFLFTLVVLTILAAAAARSKRQMLAAKAFTDQLIATANVMVVGLDSGGRITIFNQAAERISGYRRDEVIGRSWFELLVAPDATLRIWKIFSQFQQGNALPRTVDFAIRSKSGQERIMSWQNSVIESPRAAICFGIDVTERKQMEAERERFVAMVSHEFRTPLTTIDGAVQLLEMDAMTVDEATRKRYGKIQKAVDRLTVLLDDYLLQERLGRVAHGVNLTPVPPLPLLRDLQVTSSALSGEHLVSVDEEGMPVTVLCDGDLMRLTLRVLSDNAVKYTPPGSEIRLSCRHAEEGGVEFLVRDDGPGVPEDELPRLFEKFFRGRRAAQQSGTGIGLHLAHSVVTSHCGTLTARNIPDGGIEFRIWLPDGSAASAATAVQ